MAGVEKLSSEEEKAVKELQMRMKNKLSAYLYEDDTVFYRFLKARDFDVNKAEKMLQKHITFRKIYQADTIVDDFKPAEVFQKYIEPTVLGYDKEGNLVAYSPTGNFNTYEVFKCMKMNNFMKHWIWLGEKRVSISKELRKNGNKAYQIILIMDLTNLTFGNATSKLSIDVFLRFLRLYQDNYPERLKSLFVINAPSYYVFMYSILKTFMSHAMVRKVNIFGCSGWKEKLLEHIDADVLPAFLGGNRTDPDGNPLCETFVRFGGKIPEKYFLSNEHRYFKDNTKVKTITLPSSEKAEIGVYVKKAGFFIQWEFLVKGKDIGFGLFYKDTSQAVNQVIPVYKCSTPDGTEKDSYKCQSAGKYVIIFDNSYSNWLSSKEVEYCVTVLEDEA